MELSKQNLSVVIVTFKSDKVIDGCIQSIPKTIEIIVVDNSNSKSLKNRLEKKYSNVKCILSSKNLGMGSGNNLGLKYVNSDFALILNPDLVLYDNAVEQIITKINQNISFGILAPISDNHNYPNYIIKNQKSKNTNINQLLSVDSVDGYAMVLNLKRLDKILGDNYFDENFFMYLENDDLCKRIVDNGEKIFILPRSKVKHFGGQAVDPKYNYEVELSRNWHWMWSKFYFNKKHYGYSSALIEGFPSFASAIVKCIYYFITNNKVKKNIYLYRAKGYLNALLGKKSLYRPRLFD